MRVTAATRQRDAFERRAEDFSTEASKLEETMKNQLEEQKEWNKALVERRIVSHPTPLCHLEQPRNRDAFFPGGGVGKSHAPLVV